MQLKTVGESLTAINSLISITDKLKNGTILYDESLRLLKSTAQNYSTEAIKLAIAQSTLDKTQITAILSAKGLEGEVLKTTTAELAQITSTNALSSSQTKATVTTASLGTAMKGLGATLKSFFLTNPIGWGVLAVGTIGSIITAVNSHNKKIEEARQEIAQLGEEARNAVDTINSNFESTKSTVDDVSQRYAELAQGVNNLGKASQNQGNLSNDEYSEFLDISNQLAELFPRLTVGYDENGNAILDLSGDVNTITSSLNELVKAEQLAASYEIQEKMPDIWGDFSANASESNKQLEEIEEYVQKLENLDDYTQRVFDSLNDPSNEYSYDPTFNIRTNEEAQGYLEAYEELFKNAGLDINDYIINGNYDFSSLTDIQINNLKDAYASLLNEYGSTLKNAESEIETDNKNFSNYLISSLQGDSTYQQIEENFGEEGKNIIDALLTNYNFDEELSQFEGSGNWDKALQYIKDNLLLKFANMTDEDKAEFQEVYDSLLSIDTDSSLTKNTELIEQYISQLAEILNLPENQLSISLGYDLKADKEKIQTAKNRLGYRENINPAVDRDAYKRNQEISNFVNDLNESDIELLCNIDIPDETLNYTSKQLETWLEEERAKAVIEVEVRTATDAVDSFNDIKSALSSLDELYSQTVTMDSSSSGVVNGYASPDTINAVEEAFGGIAEENSVVSEALENFENTLIRFPNDAEKAQEAIDSLITAYIDQSDILNDLTEENKDWAKAQLEAMGITNAEEVVESRLNETTKDLIKQYSKLADAVDAYNSAIDTGTSEEQEKALQSLTDQLNDMYESGLKDKDGNAIQLFDTNTVTNNLQTIQDAVNGDIDAMNELAILAGKNYIAHLQIEGDTNAVTAMKNQMYSLINTFDGSNIAIGTSMDTSPIVQGLIAIGKQAGLTAQEIAEMIQKASGGTITAEMSTLKFPIFLPTINNKNGIGVTFKTTEVSIPQFKYKYTGSGKAATAHYGGGRSASSGSGGSGGGGSSSGGDEKTPETFDWIETKINRTEEALDRLDKKATNTYDLWINRNTALQSEIEKTREAINLQQTAYQAYMDKANSIGLSSDYISKVQSGAIQIEDIEDEDLKEKINRYQEWYEKAITCSDAIDDLNISLGELAETKFDNLQSEYDSLISLIEDSANLIDERLNYIEERGYFANQSYYSNLIQLENQSLQELQNEYTSLKNALSEALSTGAIEENSEAWYDMQSSINDVELAIEEAKTQVVEYNNAIRDLNWEIFDYIEERISQITAEADFLIDLLDNSNLYNDTGAFNGLGMSAVALHGVNYNTYMQQSVDYAEEYKKIQEEIAKDPYNKDLIARREELLELQQESITNAESEKEAIKSLVEEGINIHLEALSELIDKYKESLNAAKDLYDFQKNISEQTQEIANLEKIFEAYSGDTSEEARKIIQETQVSLNEARQNLEETQWDRYISDTEELLDGLYDEYEEVLNARLDDIDLLISDMIDMVNENSEIIHESIGEATDKVGYEITDSLNTALGSNGNISTLISTFNNTFTSSSTAILASIDQIKNYVSHMVGASESASSTTSSTATSSNTSSSSTTSNNTSTPVATNTAPSTGTGNGKAEIGDKVTYVSGKYHEDSYGNGRSGSKNLNGQVYITKISSKSPYPYHISTGNRLGSGDLGWVKLDQLRGYSTGIKKALDDYAWTQENGTEYIRTKDGALLTPVNGSMVFNNESSRNLWEFANNPDGYINGIIRGNADAPDYLKHISNISDRNNVVNNQNSIEISLPNVQNYSDFKRELLNDKNFEGFVQEITLGQMLGKGQLRKNKYR